MEGGGGGDLGTLLGKREEREEMGRERGELQCCSYRGGREDNKDRMGIYCGIEDVDKRWKRRQQK